MDASVVRRLVCDLFLVYGLLLFPDHTQAQNEFLQPGQPLPVARAFHGTAVLGDFIYVIGGSYLEPSNKTQVAAAVVNVAKIYPNGQLSQFIATTPLPNPRHYINNSTIVLNDTVYILGGSATVIDGGAQRTMLWTRPLSNGMLEPWRETESFAETGVECVAAFSTPGYLHMTGGLDGNGTPLNNVWSVRVRPDGSLGNWEPAPSLPKPFWFHCAAVVGGRVYVWGGLHDNSDDTSNRNPSKDIYSAPVLSSGKLGPWRVEPVQLPAGFYSASTAVAGPYLFSISPRYQGGQVSSDVWWTYVSPQGMVQWNRQPTQMALRVYHAAATDYRHGMIYVAGGKFNTGGELPRADSYFIRLSPQARAIAEQAWHQALMAHASAVSTSEIAAESDGSFSFSEQQIQGGFLALDAARELSRTSGKPLVMYFTAKKAKPCQQQDQLLEGQNLVEVFKGAVLAAIDVQQNPQVAQNYGVFQVPTWIFYSHGEEEKARGIGVQQVADLGQRVTAALQ
jgi:hypothetical protein